MLKEETGRGEHMAPPGMIRTMFKILHIFDTFLNWIRPVREILIMNVVPKRNKSMEKGHIIRIYIILTHPWFQVNSTLSLIATC